MKVENDVSVFLHEDFFPNCEFQRFLCFTQHKVENEAKLLKQAEKSLELTIWGKKNLHPKRTKTSFLTLIYLMKKI